MSPSRPPVEHPSKYERAAGPLVIRGDDGLARVRREMHGAIAEIDLGLPVVEREPSAGLRSGVVAHVAVRTA